MKSNDRHGPFVIRMILVVAALVVQSVCAYKLRPDLYRIFLYALRCVDCCLVILLVIALYCVLKKNIYSYVCVMLDCIGILISLFHYQKFITGFANDDLSTLQQFVLGPYIISSVFSWALWFATMYVGWGFVEKACSSILMRKDMLKQIVAYIFIVLSVAFLCTGVYLFALESFLLGGWALLTSALMFYTGHRAK